MNAPEELTALPHTDYVNASPVLVRDNIHYESNAWAAKEGGLILPSIRYYCADDRQTFGWTVKTNETKPNFVQAYPEVLMLDSAKPWSKLTSNPVGPLPVDVRGVENLTVDLKFAWDASGSANVALEMWLMRERDGVCEGGNNDAIAAEIMVWLDRRGSIRPAGRKVVDQVPYVTVGTSSCELWMSSGFYDDDHGVPVGPPWPYFAFLPNAPVLAGTVDLASVIRYLLMRGMIGMDLPRWLRTCELGTEIIDGELWFECDKLEARM